MNNTIIYGLVGLIVVAGGAYIVMNGSKGESMLNSDSSPKTLKELMTSSVAQKCEFEDETAAAKTSGTVYFGGGKMRGDFSATAQGTTYAAHTVSDGENIYTWIEGMPSGFKVSIDATATAEDGSQQGLDMNKEVDYNCQPWAPDNSKFQLPSGVTFNDLSAMMQGSAGAGASGGASMNQCGMCDMAPEPQRTQCRTALSCK